jgi:lariat debranching enzyme
MRSAYAIRSLEVFRLSQLSGPIDIMLSHDWPEQIWEYGNKEQLLRFKPYFREDMESGKLGSGPCLDLLMTLKPRNWYAAHMHCRFDARVNHSETEFTRFVALDKCLPQRKCLDFINIGEEPEGETPEEKQEEEQRKERKTPILRYDLEWLTILHLTNNLLNVNKNYTKLPLQPGPDEPQDNVQRFEFTPSQAEMDAVLKKFNNDLTIPQNFIQTAPVYEPQRDGRNFRNLSSIPVVLELNPQTTQICEKLGIDDPLFLTAKFSKIDLSTSTTNFSTQPPMQQEEVKVHNPRIIAPLSSFLPQPKFSNDEEINLDDLEDDVKEVDVIKDEGDAEAQQKQQNEIQIESVKEQRPNTESVDVDLNPLKKFKRRNQEIYANEDD